MPPPFHLSFERQDTREIIALLLPGGLKTIALEWGEVLQRYCIGELYESNPVGLELNGTCCVLRFMVYIKIALVVLYGLGSLGMFVTMLATGTAALTALSVCCWQQILLLMARVQLSLITILCFCVQSFLDVSWLSVGVKLATEFITAALFVWTLVAPTIFPDRSFV